MHPSVRRFRGLVGLLLLAASACHRGAAANADPASAVSVTDGDIVAIVLAANNTDLSYARLVPGRARSADVKAFAVRMTTDHTLLNARANDIAMRNGIVARDNAIGLDFRDHSAERRDVLRELIGARFDSVYVANEVQFHTDLLAALSTVLLPNVRNVELREFVTQLMPTASAHLAHAQQMRASLAARK